MRLQVIQGKHCQIFASKVVEMNGMVPVNDDISNGWHFASEEDTVGGGCSRKRKRQEPIVESHTIIGQSPHYRLAEYDDQGKCNEKDFVAAQQSLALNQDVLGVRQQTTVNVHV